MWLALLVGAAVGFVGAIPPGPVGLAVLRFGIEEGRAAGIRAALGALLIDLPCVFVAAQLASAAAEGLQGWGGLHPAAVLIARLAVAALLLAIGARWILRPPAPAEEAPTRSMSAFASGLVLALAHLASPTFLPWLALIAGTLQAYGLLAPGATASLPFAAGFGLGMMAWFVALASVAAALRERVRGDVLVAAHRLAGAILVGFGAVLVWEALASLAAAWPWR